MNQKVIEIAKILRNYARDNIFWVWRFALFEADVDDMCRIEPKIAVKYRFGDLSDIDRLDMEHHEYDAEARKFAFERLQYGDKVVLGFHNDRVIFYLWLMFGMMDIHYRNYIPISPNRVYAYKGFTVKEYRGNYVLAGAYPMVVKYIKQMGYDRIIAYIHVRNHPSIRSAFTVGYHLIGNIFKIRIVSNIRCIMNAKIRGKIQKSGD